MARLAAGRLRAANSAGQFARGVAFKRRGGATLASLAARSGGSALRDAAAVPGVTHSMPMVVATSGAGSRTSPSALSGTVLPQAT